MKSNKWRVASIVGLFVLTGSSAMIAGQEEFKKAVVEQPSEEDWFHASIQTGYMSKYIFRGNDATRGSDGDTFEEVKVSAFGITTGVYCIQQIGQGHEQQILEVAGTPTYFRSRQDRFNEFDFFAQYSHSIGPVDVTFGLVVFVFDISLETSHRDPNGALISNHATESFADPGKVFYRPFISLSTSKIPYVTPSLTYYSTAHVTQPSVTDTPAGVDVGFLEAKFKGSIPIYSDIVSINPYASVSVSFRDRQKFELSGNTDTNQFYTGFHHVQVGFDLPIRIHKYLTATPFVAYVHLINDDKVNLQDTYFAGVKASIAF